MIDNLLEQQKQAKRPFPPWGSYGESYEGWFTWCMLMHTNMKLHELPATQAMVVYNLCQQTFDDAVRQMGYAK